jgi:hypothetical protein
MIPVSLLLILVAVALLALGLTSGSSGLLIASIAASLLAAVALVIGARRNAGARRTVSPAARPAAPAASFAAEPEPGFAAEPEPDFAAEYAAAQAASAAPPARASRAAEFSAPPASDFSGPSAHDFSAPPPPAAAESVTYTDEPVTPASAHTEEIDFGPGDSGLGDSGLGDSGLGDSRLGDSRLGDSRLGDPGLGDFGPVDADEAPWRSRATPEQTVATPEAEVAAATGPDYDRAATAIHAARSEQPDENAWRRDTHAEAAAHAGLNDEFDEPDADDPDDEPLPQAVQPADAVRVARMDAEVLVVDGRPRYHLADCSHLVGRLTEPIPVNEAVELGFSPCGLCRPVDRLVAAAARH